MIKVEDNIVELKHFPDGTLNIHPPYVSTHHIQIRWCFENNEELLAVLFLARHYQEKNIIVDLFMPYIPNARQDRVKSDNDLFTLKYFSELINSANFHEVVVFDPHSNISTALINKVRVISPAHLYEAVRVILNNEDLTIFFPDEGSVKRYADYFKCKYCFGIKQRDWETGEIKGLQVQGDLDLISGKDILIVDDICSKGGTFYHAAKKLKELGAKDIYLCVSHCENTILEGDLINSGLVKQIFTTDSIFLKNHKLINIIKG